MTILFDDYPDIVQSIRQGHTTESIVRRAEAFTRGNDHGDMIAGLYAFKFAPPFSYWQSYGRFAVTTRLTHDYKEGHPEAEAFARFALDFTKDMPDKHRIIQTCLLELQRQVPRKKPRSSDHDMA